VGWRGFFSVFSLLEHQERTVRLGDAKAGGPTTAVVDHFHEDFVAAFPEMCFDDVLVWAAPAQLAG